MFKVSVVINCYNGSKYLQKTLGSLINQSFQNWELIFWDNMSKDESFDIFKKFKDKRFKYYRSQTHTTLHKARNLALKECTGNIIGFLDTDDYWHKDKLKLQLEIFKRNKYIDCVYSKFWVKYENFFLPNKLVSLKNLPTGKIFNKLLDEYKFALGSALFKREKLNNFPNIFSEKYDLISDFDFMVKFAKNNYLECVQKPIHYYRKHKSNMSLVNFKTQIDQMNFWISDCEEKKIFSMDQMIKIKKHVIKMQSKYEIQKMTSKEFLNFLFLKKKQISIFKAIIYYFFKNF